MKADRKLPSERGSRRPDIEVPRRRGEIIKPRPFLCGGDRRFPVKRSGRNEEVNADGDCRRNPEQGQSDASTADPPPLLRGLFHQFLAQRFVFVILRGMPVRHPGK